MKSSTILLRTAFLSVLLLRPTMAPAQTGTSTELLVGTWTLVPAESPGDTTIAQKTMTLRADSISESTVTSKNGTRQRLKGYWRAVGDTIRWGAPAIFPPEKFTLDNQNQRLSVYSKLMTPDWKLVEVYQRTAAAPTLIASATPAVSQTGPATNLVGTWTGVPTEDPLVLQRGEEHTLLLRSDSIFEQTVGASTWKGYWRASGDTLWFGSIDESGLKVTLQGQRLTLTNRDPKQSPYSVLQRK